MPLTLQAGMLPLLGSSVAAAVATAISSALGFFKSQSSACPVGNPPGSFTVVSSRALAAPVASTAAGFPSIVLESRRKPPTGLSGSTQCSFLSLSPLPKLNGPAPLLGSPVAAVVAAAVAAAVGFFESPFSACPVVAIVLGSFTVVCSRALVVPGIGIMSLWSPEAAVETTIVSGLHGIMGSGSLVFTAAAGSLAAVAGLFIISCSGTPATTAVAGTVTILSAGRLVDTVAAAAAVSRPPEGKKEPAGCRATSDGLPKAKLQGAGKPYKAVAIVSHQRNQQTQRA
mmetsp:Transcript_24235/g.43345  ORF Transcript_24235/g.43345 Transcript_24235/m.43345 type:complete len:285 (-) Transcript_24235:213-1067(-)